MDQKVNKYSYFNELEIMQAFFLIIGTKFQTGYI